MEEKFVEIQKLLKALREKHEAFEANALTKAEWEEVSGKLNARIDALEVASNRPPAGEGGQGSGDSAYKKAFLDFMRNGKAEMAPESRKALVADASGQILIPEELEKEVYRALPGLTIMRNLATVRTIATDRIRRRSLTELTVGWGKIETGADLHESDVTPGYAYQYVENLNGLTKVGQDELADTDTALESILVDSFGRAMAEAEDTAFVIGTGHDNEMPEGILDGTTVDRVNAGQIKAVKFDDILEIEYELPAQYRRSAVFLTNSKTEKYLRTIKTGISGDNRYLWEPSLQAGKPNRLFGYPIYTQDDIPLVPTGGGASDVLIFGDFKAGYRILDRMGMTVQRLTELYAEQDLVGIKVKKRVGGGVIREDAFRVLRVPASV